MAYDPGPWHDFYVMAGGAAAALAGLLFVAMSLHADAIMRNPFFRYRAIGTLTSLTTQLVLAFGWNIYVAWVLITEVSESG